MLFLHIVPIMAAVAIRPHQADDREGLLPSALNVLILLIWWVAVYAFFVFPDEYIVTNIALYSPRWNLLYIVEGLILIAVSASAFFTSSGSWRVLYRNIFFASVFYTFVSEAMNAAFLRGLYKTGGIYDLPYLAAGLRVLLGRHRRAALPSRYSGDAFDRTCQSPGRSSACETRPALFAPHGILGTIPEPRAALSAPGPFCCGHGRRRPPGLCHFPPTTAAGPEASALLKRSHRSFDNLQRLQGRVIQQAKLASLGELVALAASELEFPLSAILSSSERMAASSNLSREQLSNAQKIGQQARRTRELVSDLLSFAQQTPGEKSPLELKPLLQRAVQMEGFKLENKKISLSVESNDNAPLPRVLGNSNQLLQAFVQIVENAVDALQEIGGGRVQVSLWREGDEVIVQFADSGPGLRDPERVFDPFYTTKPVGKGTGLGLSATYGVIQDHKGQITCNNRPEGGAVFEIRLPALKTAAPLAETARGLKSTAATFEI